MKRQATVAPLVAAIGWLLVSSSCSFRRPAAPALPQATTVPSEIDLVRVDPDSLGELVDDLSPASLATAIGYDLEYLGRLPGDRVVRFVDAACSVAELRLALAELRNAVAAGGSLDAFARRHFFFYRSTGRPNGTFFTGYYEPVVEGRRRREGSFVYPLYRRPADLREPYYSRREIDSDEVLAGRGLELVWLADPVDRFFLQVQGSGVIRLEDGAKTRVGFAGSNGRPYTSIGRALVDAGWLRADEASAPMIQHVLREHPDQIASILSLNERYVFFHEVADGPIGSTGVKLTPGRSVAPAPSVYPPGMLAYIRTRVPIVQAGLVAPAARPLRRFVFSQDAGGAIVGPGRVDLYFGTGVQAGWEAGAMSTSGELYFLIPNCN